MKCVIIYSSLTGNTEKIAKAIQAGVKEAAGHCDILKFRDANPRTLKEYDLIGLGSLVIKAEPSYVSDFIKDMRFVGGKHVFAFSTHGASPLFFFPSIYPKLKAKGLEVIGMRDWYGEVNIYHFPKPYPTDGHPDATDLKEAEDFGREMVENSRRISAGETQLIPPATKPPELPKGSPPPPKFNDPLYKIMKYHKEKCLEKCHLCMDNCPVCGIDLTVDPPIIADPCVECEACIRVCPTGALEADSYVTLDAGPLMGAVKQMFIPFLAGEEAAGRFRRHVPVEEIGWDTPPGKFLGDKHPHWINGKGYTVSPKDTSK